MGFRISVLVGGVGILCAGQLALTPRAEATEVKIFRAQSASALAGGEFDGTSLDGEGRLRLAARFDRLAGLDEPFVFSVARRSAAAAASAADEGWVVGTGNEGKVLAIDSAGKVSELFRVEEPEVFALWVDGDGAIYAAGSPGGRVYRHARGQTAVVFDSKERYVWALARSSQGELLVATGVEGKLFALDTTGTPPFASRLLVDTDATHLRSVLPLADGRTLIGTASDGRLLELSPQGELRTLHDSALAEVVALAPIAPVAGTSPTDRGLAYAAVLDSDAGFVEVAQSAPAANSETPPGEGAAKVDEIPRRAGGTRSEILRLDRDGGVEALRSFTTDTVFSMAAHDGRLWIGSGLEGKLWSLRDDVLVLEKDFEERQVVGLASVGRSLVAVTTNGGALHRSTGALPDQGTYTSEVLDAAAPSRFGALRWRGTGGGAERGTVRFSWRSGNAVLPDGTWTPWSQWSEGSEFDLAALPTTRYLQWRLSLSASGQTTPIVSGIEIAYRARNLAPRVRRFTALEPGEVLLPQSFTVGTQVFEPVHPTREGMFTTLGAPRLGDDPKLKSVWKRGMRTLRWESEDANQDALRATLWARRESPGKSSGSPGEWLEMVKDLTDEYWSFDETALPDGVYRFKLAVTDEDANEPGDGVLVERLSDPVSVDGTAPRQRAAARRSGDGWRVDVVDDMSPLRVAEWSADGGAWKPAIAADGLVDGANETLRIDAPATARFVVLRVVDASWNVATFDLLEISTR